MLIKHLFRLSIRQLIKAKLLGLICLLFVSAGLTYAQGNPTLSIDDVAMIEGDSNFFQWDFTITLSAPSTQPISVTVTSQPGSAASNVDFVAGSVVVNIPAGRTSQTVGILVTGDTVVEGAENFVVNLSNPVNATIADGQGVGTITDDDGVIILITQPGTQRAAALDSVNFIRDVLPIINERNFSPDQRTRLALFAIGLKLAPGESAATVIATVEDPQGTVRQLPVEFVGQVPNFPPLTQIVLKLTDQIAPGDAKIKISLHGLTSNTVLVGLKLQ